MMTTSLTVGTIENAAVIVGNPFNSATKADWINFCDVQSPTQVTYDKAIENFLKYLAENKITAPKREDVIGYRSWLLGSGYKVSSARLYLTIVKKFFGWLSSKGLYLNVADGVKLPAQPTEEHARDALTAQEAKATISSFKGKDELTLRNKAIMSLMLGCGLRSVEVVRLDIGDIEKRHGHWFIKVHGKARAGKTDSVAVSSKVKAIIDEYLSVRPKGKKNSPLFISTAKRNCGQRLQTQSISRLAKRTFAKIGIESDRITCHSCRHTAATVALQAGVELRQVQQLLRHRSATTTQIYLHDIDAFNNPAVNKISEILFS